MVSILILERNTLYATMAIALTCATTRKPAIFICRSDTRFASYSSWTVVLRIYCNHFYCADAMCLNVKFCVIFVCDVSVSLSALRQHLKTVVSVSLLLLCCIVSQCTLFI